jgi:hypothetical protein
LTRGGTIINKAGCALNADDNALLGSNIVDVDAVDDDDIIDGSTMNGEVIDDFCLFFFCRNEREERKKKVQIRMKSNEMNVQ